MLSFPFIYDSYTPCGAQCYRSLVIISLASRLFALIFGPYSSKTQGTAVNRNPSPPRNPPAPWNVIVLNICVVNLSRTVSVHNLMFTWCFAKTHNGNAPPNIFLQNDCAANAELAYR